MSEIVVDKISKTFYLPKKKKIDTEVKVEALKEISFTVNKNEFVSIIGPSGCGKTTLIRIIDCLLSPDSGRVLIDGHEVTKPGFDRAMVFQGFGLLPWKNVVDNIAFGLKMKGVDKHERLRHARHYAEVVGLKGFEDHYPHQLSGGMQQRVGIARALCINSNIFLMDEPLGSLDAQTREYMQEEILRLLDNEKRTVLFITHSIDEAVFLSDRIILLKPRPGQVEEIIDVDLPKPRFGSEVRTHKRFVEIRTHIWEKLRNYVANEEKGGE
jgi:NitT/TauT family transport system ATP-binding protein